jgi:hypothetical protein
MKYGFVAPDRMLRTGDIIGLQPRRYRIFAA